MRPIKLVITAFGPYANRTEIDFTKLGSNGIYLITGDTGAGKSTIFDAISYALYGTASVEHRSKGTLRSKYADEKTKTSVELTFLSGWKEYFIRRELSKINSTNDSKGWTSTPELKLPDGRIFTKKSDVKNEIQKIIGIDEDQFKQVVMIAQGDFAKLIYSESKEKTEILRKIFHTEPLKEIENILEKKAKEAKDDLNDKQESAKKCLDDVRAVDGTELSDELAKLKATDIKSNETEKIELISKILESDKLCKEELDLRHSTLRRRLDETNQTLGKLKEQKKNNDILSEKKGELTKEKLAWSNAKTALEEAKKLYPKRDDIIARITEISNELGKYSELDEKTAELNSLCADRQTLCKNRDMLLQEKDEIERDIKESETELQELQNPEARLHELSHKEEKNSAALALLEKLEKDIDDYLDKQRKYKKLTAQLTAEASCKSAIEDEYTKKSDLYLKEQAGILAKELKDGVACPVCGSTSHPSPAELAKDAPTKEELDKLKEQRDRAENNAAETGIKCERCKSEIENAETQLHAEIVVTMGEEYRDTALSEGLFGSIAKRRDVLINNSRVLKRDLNRAKADIARRSELSEYIPKARTALGQTTQNLSECEKSLSVTNEKINAAENEHKKLTKDLTFNSKNSAQREIDRLSFEKKKIEDEFNHANESFNSKNSEVTALSAEIKQLSEQLAGYNEEVFEATLKESNELDVEITAVRNEVETIADRISDNEKALSELKVAFAELNESEKHSTMVTLLSNTARGELNGKEGISLEAYAQAVYFERVLKRANLRLRIMSGGQYDFVRRDEVGDKRKKGGLVLNVIDHYDGSERSVTSLSGGEIFEASLSLALGLSDEIQSTVGGVQLDTMFVDEGFGSLSSESLSKTMDALRRLADDNCLVGIISHVEALKARIDKQIVVKKQNSGGSKVEIVV